MGWSLKILSREVAVLRLIGGLFIVVGLILTITVVGAAAGIPLMLLGLLFVIVGRKKTIIVRVQSDRKR